MAYDDEDNPSAASTGRPGTDQHASPTPASSSSQPSPPLLAAAAADRLGEEEEEDDEEDGEGTQDFTLLAASLNKRAIAAQTVRRGEKDFESHGTRAQAGALEESRRVMESVLSYTRVHRPDRWRRAWYFPDYLREAIRDDDEDDGGGGGRGGEGEAEGRDREVSAAKRKEMFALDRVVVCEGSSGVYVKSMGRGIPGLAKDDPSKGQDWLLPEEALLLVERGSLDLWWPLVSMDRIFAAYNDRNKDAASQATSDEAVDQYDLGLPLSLEAAYSLLIGHESERGKVTLQRYQVYANLNRAGFTILRSPPPPVPIPFQASPTQIPFSLWRWLFSLLHADNEDPRPPYGPLVRPGFYRSYRSIYQQLDLVARHETDSTLSQQDETQPPFQVCYHLWKGAAASFSKTRPPPPDFWLAVVDAHDSLVPSMEEISALLATTPRAPPKKEWQAPHALYARLRHGYRNVLVAVVDHGIVNYMRFAEGAFGGEPLWPRFDSGGGPRASKGGRGGRGGYSRGGRGGRGGRHGKGRSGGSRGKTS